MSSLATSRKRKNQVDDEEILIFFLYNIKNTFIYYLFIYIFIYLFIYLFIYMFYMCNILVD